MLLYHTFFYNFNLFIHLSDYSCKLYRHHSGKCVGILCSDLPGYVRTLDKNFVVGPSSADSANSHHFFFSLVQKANGIAKKIMFNIFIPKMASDGDGGIWKNQDNLIPTTQKLGSKYR